MSDAPNHININDAAIDASISRLMAGPIQPDAFFVLGRQTYADIYAMAAHLRPLLQAEAGGPPICLCAEDKAVVAAALLAAMAGGPPLVLPYSLAPAALNDLRALTGFRHAVVDGPRDVPRGVRATAPRIGGTMWPAMADVSPKRAGSEWVRLFTGGSTGTPRMWNKTVRNLMSESLSIIASYRITPSDRLLATVSPTHIYGLLYAILTPLLANAMVAGETPSFPAEISSALTRDRASILVSVPAHYRAMKGHPLASGMLRQAFSSAGMLALEDAEAFYAQTGVGIAEIYGSTETGGIGVRTRADDETDFGPCAGVMLRIDGECLSVRSEFLSPGLADPESGFFTVSDRVRSNRKGRFTLLGRADGIVKVGGQRVDLEGVRQAIKGLSGVTEALVISLPVGRARENQVVALVEGSVRAFDVNRAMTIKLPPYARPRCVKVVPRIPVTAAGKFDRSTIAAYFSTDALSADTRLPD